MARIRVRVRTRIRVRIRVRVRVRVRGYEKKGSRCILWGKWWYGLRCLFRHRVVVSDSLLRTKSKSAIRPALI